MITKETIDKMFLVEIPKLTEIIPKIINKYNRNYLETNTVINECYIYLIENQTKLKTERDIKAMIINWVNQNCGPWTNSKMNIKEKLTPIEYLDYESVEKEDDDEIDYKIAYEKDRNKKLYILALYREHLYQSNKKIELIIFDKIFKNGCTSGAKLAKNLKITKNTACKYMREFKADLKQFIEDKTHLI